MRQVNSSVTQVARKSVIAYIAISESWEDNDVLLTNAWKHVVR